MKLADSATALVQMLLSKPESYQGAYWLLLRLLQQLLRH